MTTRSFNLAVLGWCIVLVTFAVALAPYQDDDDGNEAKKLDLARREAIILWVGLGIASVLFIGIGLIWGVTRGARRVLRKREAAPTEMPNIWYLNPPDKRKQGDP